MEGEHEPEVENWDELYELYLAYRAELDAESGMERPRKSREEFPAWVESLAPHVRAQLVGHWKKGLRRVLAEENAGIERYRWGESLRQVVAGEG